MVIIQVGVNVQCNYCHQRLREFSINSFLSISMCRNSVQRLATGWTVRGSNPGVCEIFRTDQTGPVPTQPSIPWVPGYFQS